MFLSYPWQIDIRAEIGDGARQLGSVWARDSLAMFAEFGMRAVWVESSVVVEQLCCSGSQAPDSAWDS